MIIRIMKALPKGGAFLFAGLAAAFVFDLKYDKHGV
jgi:hypothetical protein